MAASLNKVILIGNLTRDPELRYIASGQPVVNFSIGVNRNYVTQSGERKNEASFIRIVVWGKVGEACNEYLRKGSPVCVEGRLQSRSWEAQDGSKRNSVEVVANNVQFLGRGGAGSSRDSEAVTQEALPKDDSNEIGIGEVNEGVSQEGSDLVMEDQPPF